MSHLTHIQKNKAHLEQRAHILRCIREFFWSQNFLEVETPLILGLPGQEPYLSPMKVSVHNEKGEMHQGYLHTSPEYTMKKMLGAGFEKIFSLTKTFRDYESFGGTHNPEFTMVEWYRNNQNMYDIMEDCEALFAYISKYIADIKKPGVILSQETCGHNASDQCFRFLAPSVVLERPWKRIHMRDLWRQYIGVNLDEYLTVDAMRELNIQQGFNPKDDEPYEDLFYRLFLNKIEPYLGVHEPTIVHHYPSQMAALARVDVDDPNYAERFEIYIDGIELANAFGELTDPVEQKKRLEEEQEHRRRSGKDVFDVDQEFIDALGHVKSAAGIALGVDRLVQLFTGCKNIDDVLVLPASKLFNKG